MYALQIAAVLFGLGLIALFNLSSPKRIKLLLAFSGAYLFSIVIIHFLPELFEHGGAEVGVFILAGFLLQILLDFYSTGLEHGHFHSGQFKHQVFPVAAIGGLYIHALFEGLPVSLQQSELSGNVLLIAIVLHKIPITVVLYSLLYTLNIKSKYIWWAIVLFALMSPIGTAIGQYVPGLHEFAAHLTAFATGIFLHVSTTILFESSHNHKYNLAKLLVVVLGMGTAYLSLAFVAH
jgi:zinc transporter ZupT